ncbi:MAG: class IV adenylate cyclase [Acidobacteria bacterium]|nr:class IV adenylate cyclase [Acidobacteriota bacterium]
MSGPVEREIKLRFESAAAARGAVIATGAAPRRPRQLQDDRLLDWPDGRLRERGCTLRVRDQRGAAALTFKGPPQPDAMKVREELETVVGDAPLLLRLLEQLGLRVWFRYQKYREEYELPGVVLTIDETPIGAFVELEGDEQGITDLAVAMGRTPGDYVVDSYYRLFAKARGGHPDAGVHMVFDSPSS